MKLFKYKPQPKALFIAAGMVCFFSLKNVSAQVEHVTVAHPVYDFLLRGESKEALKNFSNVTLPLQRKQIIEALREMRQHASLLSEIELPTLERFEREFQIIKRNNAIIISSPSDSVQVLSDRFFSNDEKFIYRNADADTANTPNSVQISPLASLDIRTEKTSIQALSATLGQVGFRLFGTISGSLGYSLQVTNGALLSGSRSVAMDDPRIRQNIKFGLLDSDFDFTESHLRYDNNWFYASIGRENRQIGAGFFNKLYTSTNAPAYDAITVGGRWKHFEYRFMHGSLLGFPTDTTHYGQVGSQANIPEKMMAFHRFAVRGSWGEIGFQEAIIYSRGWTLAYLNPLSFFKSLEHAERDRDNALMGLDATIRPFKGFQIKGTWILDDIRFEQIGKDWWSNKTAYNIGAMYSLPAGVDVIAEYSHVTPYTFTHFNRANNVTHDQQGFMGNLPPNSDEITLAARWWFGGRYPLQVTASHRRWGRNIITGDSLTFNAGGDINQTIRWLSDQTTIPFLSGDVEYRTTIVVSTGWEIVRGFNVQGNLGVQNINGSSTLFGRFGIRFEDF